jgi:4-amino-4-deoxy-L-arabinose transferase-like glycosyltransferase
MRRGSQNGPYISEGFLALAVVLVAFGLRLLHVIFTAGGNPLAANLALDAAVYDRWAKTLVWGGPAVPTLLMQAPLYPWLLSLIYHICGPNLTAARFVQALLGTTSCGFIIVVTRRLFKSSLAGIIAGLIAALYLPFIFYEGMLVPATLVVFLSLLSIVLLVPERRDPGLGRTLVAGVVLGLCAAAKPVAMLLVPFALLHLRTSSRSVVPGHPFLRRAGALAAGVVLALVPLVVRNYRVAGEFIPLTTGGGINFYIGNNPRAIGYYSVPFYGGRPIGATPEEQLKRMREFAEAERGRTLSPAAVSRFWFERGIGCIRSDPKWWAALTWRKFLLFWNRHERANVESMSFHRRFGGVLGLPLLTFGVVAPLALLGIFMTRERWRDLWLLYGGIITYLAAALLFYVLARYRLPVLAFLIPFAGAAAAGLLKLLRDEKWSEPVLLAAALLVLSYFINMKIAGDTPAGTAGNLKRLANVYIAEGDTTSAVESLREAARSDPADTTLVRYLELLERRGRGK